MIYRYESGLAVFGEYIGDIFFEPVKITVSKTRFLNLTAGFLLEDFSLFKGFYIYNDIRFLTVLKGGVGFNYNRFVKKFYCTSENYLYSLLTFEIFNFKFKNGLSFLFFTVDQDKYKIPFFFTPAYGGFSILFMYHISYSLFFYRKMFEFSFGINNFDEYRVDNLNNPTIFINYSFVLMKRLNITTGVETKIAGFFGLAGRANSIKVFLSVNYRFLPEIKFRSVEK
ncbi:MAG: hypothetical protein KAS39_06185 [Actinomycetia bacterium]|nr:hypothetical protein [Actinomycetes bacterium]